MAVVEHEDRVRGFAQNIRSGKTAVIVNLITLSGKARGRAGCLVAFFCGGTARGASESRCGDSNIEP